MINIIKRSNSPRSKVTLLKLAMISLILAVTFPACDSDGTLKPQDNNACQNSNHDAYRTLDRDAETREYILHIPASYDDNTATPLVLNFHGFGGCAADFAADVGEALNLNALADSENFIVAYPQGVIRTKGDTEWDPGDNGRQNINENDVYFVEQLISDISAEFNVDGSRVYATGYSNGGMMAYGLACTSSDLIAAVGIMSGVMLADDCDANEYTSVIHFHGIEDEVLPYDGNQDYQSISDIIQFWLDHNNIPASSLVTTELNDGDVVRDVYAGGTEDTDVVLYTVKNEFDKPGGHVWFSDDIDGSTPNQILWDFLSAYSL